MRGAICAFASMELGRTFAFAPYRAAGAAAIAPAAELHEIEPARGAQRRLLRCVRVRAVRVPPQPVEEDLGTRVRVASTCETQVPRRSNTCAVSQVYFVFVFVLYLRQAPSAART
jgi:hypothetical protein